MEKNKRVIKPYHHGDLRAAILDAGERLLEEKGVDGFSLRAVAKMANVSPAAPLHHFKSITGIFSSLAARGYDELDQCLYNIEDKVKKDSREYLRRIIDGYLEFAANKKSLFRLMFDCEKLDWEQEDLKISAWRSLNLISEAIEGRTVLKEIEYQTPDEMPSAEVAANWAIMHGFAHLLIEQQLDFMAGEGKEKKFAMTCVETILKYLVQ